MTMTEEGRKCRKKGSVLVVGVKLAPSSRELLTWTLAKFTNPGDLVIALHVTSSPPESDISTSKPDTTNQQVEDIFKSVIGVYEGFCSIKKIDLQVKVTNGISVRKVLVQEARFHGALKLVLGTSGKHISLGSSFSLAKYCAKRLPLTCSVLVIQHGKIAFQRGGALPMTGSEGSSLRNNIPQAMRSYNCKGPGQCSLERRTAILEMFYKSKPRIYSSSMASESTPCSCSLSHNFINSPVSVLHAYKYGPPRMQGWRSCLPGRQEVCPICLRDGMTGDSCEVCLSEHPVSDSDCSQTEEKLDVLDINTERSFIFNNTGIDLEVSSTAAPTSHHLVGTSTSQGLEDLAYGDCTVESKLCGDLSLKLEEENSPKRKPSQVCCQVEITPAACISSEAEAAEMVSPIIDKTTRPGWPLLHQSISQAQVSSPRTKARQMSVVEWALRLPDRQTENFKQLVETSDDYCLRSSNLIRQSQDKAEYVAASSDSTPSSFPHIACTEKEPNQCGNSSKLETSIAEGSIWAGYLSKGVADRCQSDRKMPLTQRLNSFCQKKPCIQFSFDELEAATCNFSPGKLIGKGGCSRVYQGFLSSGRVVAVKCLNLSIPEAEEEILTEVEILSAVKHSHIVELVGYCADSQNYLLVYNFASNGNLEQSLHGGMEKPALSWEIRQKVAVGIAEALNYLHDGCARPVVHRDVKSSNILLSDDFEPQLTDFGLAKWAPTASTHITCSDVVGTFGYLAPEYFMYGKVNEKTDVYSFGVVLLELITGRQPIDTLKPKGQENLVMWARPLLEGNLSLELVDSKLKGVYNIDQIKNMMLAAALCLRQSGHHRPRINRILKLLHGDCEELGQSARQEHAIAKEIDEGYDIPYYGNCDIRTHLTLALLGVDDDVASEASMDQSVELAHSNKYLEEYLGGRYSRQCSFD